jgi:hypothetical protein
MIFQSSIRKSRNKVYENGMGYRGCFIHSQVSETNLRQGVQNGMKGVHLCLMK